ncbi:MAG: DNA polymerase III subunit delta [Betaproteobacteria bacterium TMED82]|nr:MAG: DNA polymerase III subunit delta [Betaproteobacteria bacterium TMED82]
MIINLNTNHFLQSNRIPSQIKHDLDSIGMACSSVVIWLVCSDELVLLREATRKIIEMYDDGETYTKTVLIPTNTFNWEELLVNSSTGNLFFSRQLIDLKLYDGKASRRGGEIIISWAERSYSSSILILSAPALDTKMKKLNWVKAIEKKGVVINIKKITPHDLKLFIGSRLKERKIDLSPEALEIFYSRCENNLSSASQEIDKLTFIIEAFDNSLELKRNILEKVISNSCLYNPFKLPEELMKKDQSSQYLKMMSAFKKEDFPLPLIIFILAQYLRKTISGTDSLKLMKLYEIDKISKGLKSGNAWVELERLFLGV